MYQLWKNIRRGLVYDSQQFFLITFGLTVVFVAGSYSKYLTNEMSTWCEPHSGSFNEEARQFAIRNALAFRQEMQTLRQQKFIEE